MIAINLLEAFVVYSSRLISGPSSLQLSNYWHVGESFKIDFFPSQDLVQFFKEKEKSQPKVLLRTLLSEFTAKSIVLELQQLIWAEQSELRLAILAHLQLEQIADQLHAFSVKPSGTEGYRTAEVTLGGVDTSEVSSKTMESKKQKGLYFIGEVLDVTGHLGRI